jgi:hypothetical protein
MATEACQPDRPGKAACLWSRIAGCGGESNTPTHRRAFRVTLLLFACVLMSFLDLELTLMFARSVGMYEINPIARAIMVSTGSALAVIGFKLATVAFACAVLYWARHRRSSEIATWLCFATLLTLSIRWLDYGKNVSELTPTYDRVAEVDAAGWVKMDD